MYLNGNLELLPSSLTHFARPLSPTQLPLVHKLPQHPGQFLPGHFQQHRCFGRTKIQ